MSRAKELAKNTLILSIGSFLPKLMALITVPIITGQLTRTEYGTYDLVCILVSLLLPVTTLQIQSAAFRFLIDCRKDQEEIKKVITNIYVFIIPVSLITLLFLYFFLSKVDYVTRVLITVYFFIDCLFLATQQIVRGLSNNKLFSMSSILKSAAYMLFIILFVYFADQGLNGVLLSSVLANTVGLSLLLVYGRILKKIDFSAISFQEIRNMLGYSWPMIPNTLSNWVLSASDRFVLTAFWGIEAVAIYGVANKIPNLINTVKGSFVFAWQENASLALLDEGVEKYYSDMFDRIYCIVAGAMGMLIGTTPILFTTLIRGDYSDSYSQMPVLFMGVFFSVLSSFLGGIYVAHKRTKNVGITTMIAAVCNLIIDLALVNRIGIYAASVSTLVSYALLAAYRMKDVKRFQAITYRNAKIGITLLCLSGMCVICWINSQALNVINFIVGSLFAVILNKSLWHQFGKQCLKKVRKG